MKTKHELVMQRDDGYGTLTPLYERNRKGRQRRANVAYRRWVKGGGR